MAPIEAVDVTERDSPCKPLIIKDIVESDLLNYGVPTESLDDVRDADEDGLLEIAGVGVSGRSADVMSHGHRSNA